MSLKHILLGLLHEPASGYDLKKEFNTSLKHFWDANLSQIYPLLGEMEQLGLLASREKESDKGPPRKVYRRTAKGTRELVSWLAEGPHVSSEKRHYLAQVFFLYAFRDPDKALAFMESLRDTMQGKLEALQASERQWRECDPRYPDDLPDEYLYRQMTLDLGLEVFATYVQWCDRCIAKVKRRRSPVRRRA